MTTEITVQDLDTGQFIVGMVEEASRYANEVTSAASQQAASLGEVNGAMTELVRVAESLQNETEQMKVEV